MGVMLQAFYWDCPNAEGVGFGWWKYLQGKLPAIQKAGFTAMWLPPANKGGEPTSMGYDPYDYFDLGEFDQKGSVPTYFGDKASLIALVAAAKAAGLQTYADIVINHNNGADLEEMNPLSDTMMWTKFTPVSGVFARDWRCFHPSTFQVKDEYPPFAGMPQLCHQNPAVYAAIMEYTRRMFEDIGFDGFRFDYVKGYGPWMIKAIAQRLFEKPAGNFVKPFCVAEYWDGQTAIDTWLGLANSFNDNPVSAFDFPLHYRLQGMCDTFGFDMHQLLADDTVVATEPSCAVTFVDNHDTIRNDGAIVNDKMMAYAFILTHEGYPCVFWQDYFNFGLARTGSRNGIDALVEVHEQYAGGATSNLWVEDDLYIMQRGGYGGQAGLVLALNNRGDGWHGANVQTQWANRKLTAIAWDGHDPSQPGDKWTDGEGRVDMYAGPRGFAVYVPS